MSLGFIILRHVNSNKTNKYWLFCYNSIRKYYPENRILIIDDNSNYDFIKQKKLYKTSIIQSEYPKRGELLPYYYYLHNKLFDTAVIIHDSVFINEYIDFTVDKYKLLWTFKHDWDQIEDETIMIDLFNDLELKKFYENKNLWDGCFGSMSIIEHDYLVFVNNKYDISKLLKFVLNRYNRMSFERIIGCLLQKNIKIESKYGDIFKYVNYDIIGFKDKNKHKHLPLIKIFTGR